MAKKIDPRDFLLNTDYEMDKIILVKTGNLTSSVEIPHNLDFIPLPFGVWSTDPDFNSCNPIGSTDPNSEPGYTPQLGVECYADSTKVKITASNNTGNATIYYRLYAFMPNDVNKNAPTTGRNSKLFVLNTDYNYNKICAKGVFTQSNESYTHNLGYIPQVMAWYRYTVGGTKIYPLMQSSEYTNVYMNVDDTKIQFGNFWAGVIDKVYWRIYYDEA